MGIAKSPHIFLNGNRGTKTAKRAARVGSLGSRGSTYVVVTVSTKDATVMFSVRVLLRIIVLLPTVTVATAV